MRGGVGVLIVGTLASCSSAAPREALGTSAVVTHSGVSAVCPSRLSAEGNDVKEIKGEAPEGESLYGLLFADYPVAKGRVTKIAWRMTGAGALILAAMGPAGQRISPVSGPEVHTSSSWSRPGGEWGSGFVFDAPGCWTITATRGTTVAHAMVLVG